MTRSKHPDGMPRIDDDWLMDALAKPARAPTKSKKSSNPKLPPATFDWQNPDRIVDDVQSGIEDLILALNEDTDSREHTTIPDDIETYVLRHASDELAHSRKTPNAAPTHKTPSLSHRIGQHMPTSINIASSIFNGTIAAGIFFVMSAHNVTACDMLPEPVRTNMCGFKPR